MKTENEFQENSITQQKGEMKCIKVFYSRR